MSCILSLFKLLSSITHKSPTPDEKSQSIHPEMESSQDGDEGLPKYEPPSPALPLYSQTTLPVYSISPRLQQFQVPPELPAMPFPLRVPRETPPPPVVPGVGPPAPAIGPPTNPTLIILPGTRTGFKLAVRQHPERTGIFEFGENHRFSIDPPPIVELVISSTEKEALILQCTLWNEEGTEHRNIIRTTTGIAAKPNSDEAPPKQLEEKHAPAMIGKISTSAVYLKDEHSKYGLFYIFPDLSIRVEGRYRLKFDLHLVLPPDPLACSVPNRVVAEVFSDIFVVYPAEKFPGMMKSTALTKAIANQGIQINMLSEP